MDIVLRSVTSFVRRRVLLLVCLGLVVLPPAIAYASVVQTYRQSVNQVGGQWHTFDPQFASRDFNRVYHQAGRTWGLTYCYSNGSCLNYYFGTANPTVDPWGGEFYAEAWCYNVNDGSGVNWTCQTTRP